MWKRFNLNSRLFFSWRLEAVVFFSTKEEHFTHFCWTNLPEKPTNTKWTFVRAHGECFDNDFHLLIQKVDTNVKMIMGFLLRFIVCHRQTEWLWSALNQQIGSVSNPNEKVIMIISIHKNTFQWKGCAERKRNKNKQIFVRRAHRLIMSRWKGLTQSSIGVKTWINQYAGHAVNVPLVAKSKWTCVNCAVEIDNLQFVIYKY